VRRAILTSAIAQQETLDAPGLVLLDAANRVDAVTPAARHWLGELLFDEELPSVVHALATTPAAPAARTPPAPSSRPRPALAHVVSDLELEMHEAEIVRGEHVGAVVPIARWRTRGAGDPDRLTVQLPSADLLWVIRGASAAAASDGVARMTGYLKSTGNA
jgi:hypothetical protein